MGAISCYPSPRTAFLNFLKYRCILHHPLKSFPCRGFRCYQGRSYVTPIIYKIIEGLLHKKRPYLCRTLALTKKHNSEISKPRQFKVNGHF